MDLSSRPITGFLPIFAVFELAALYLLQWLDSDTKLIVAVPSAFAAVSFSVLAFVFRKRAGRKAISALLLTVSVTAGASLGIFLSRCEFNIKREEVLSYVGKTAVIEGEITGAVYESDFVSYYHADISSVGGKSVSFPLKIEASGGPGLGVCDKFSCQAEFRGLDGTRYVYGDSYIEGKGIYASAVCTDIIKTGTAKNIRYYSNTVNEAAAAALSDAAGEGADLANALILGRKAELSDTLKRDFRSLGISHLLALSGLHFSVIIGSLGAVLTLFRVKRVPKYIILLLSSVAFAFLTGFGVTVSRAAFMMILFCAAKLIGRQTDSLASLSAAAIVITAVSPSSALNVGFQLSFSATLGIILLAPEANLAIAHITAKQSVGETAAQKAKRKIKGVLLLFPLALYIGTAATLFTLPITVETFGSFSALSFFFTALFSIPATLLIYSGFAVLILSPVPFLPKIPGFLCEKLSELIKFSSSRLADGRYLFSLNYDFVPYISVITAAVLLTGLLIRSEKRIHLRLFVFLSAAILFYASYFCCYTVVTAEERGSCTVSYLNCGASEMMTVKADGHGAVIDMSTGGSEGVRAADTLLDESAVPEPEALILTHYHLYHPQTITKYCEESFLKDIYLPFPAGEREEEYYAATLEAANAAGLSVHIYDRVTGVISFYGVEIKIPYFGYIERSAHPVFAVSAGYGNGRAVYLSSALWESDADIAAAAKNCLMLIVGSHGPKAETAFSLKTAAKIYAPTRYKERFQCGFAEVYEDDMIKIELFPPQKAGAD